MLAIAIAMLDFEQLFHSNYNIMSGTYKGVGGREWGRWWGRVNSQRQVIPSIRTQEAVQCLQ